MTALPKHRMTVDEFLAWNDEVLGRYELLDCQVYEMQSERLGHARIKLNVHLALSAAITQAGAACHVLPDGMLVPVDDKSGFEPDALVYCGAPLADETIKVVNPVIVVEVLSPSTRHIELSHKFIGYFRVQSIHHYLIVDQGKQTIVHHARQKDGTILSKLVSTGLIKLDPPGLEISIDGLLK